jgi:hypothetical protein
MSMSRKSGYRFFEKLMLQKRSMSRKSGYRFFVATNARVCAELTLQKTSMLGKDGNAGIP